MFVPKHNSHEKEMGEILNCDLGQKQTTVATIWHSLKHPMHQ